MTTLPPVPHEQRHIAESFGIDAERYDRTRPSYPEALIERIVARSPGPELLCVGCGTGIDARQFMEAGCEVLGVEVDERMAAFAHNTGVVVEVARFEEWNPKGRRFDGVAAGQAWHWIHPVEGAAKAATVLRPSGLLALFWNGPLPPPELAEACNEIFRQAIPESPFNLLSGPSSSYTSFLTRAFDGIEKAGRFEGLEDWQFEWERTYTKEQWLDQLPATGALTSARPDQIEEVLTGVGGVVDAIGGHFEMRFVTVAAIAVRI